MKALILSLLLAMTPSGHDTESAAERRARLEVIAESINTAAAGDVTVAAFLTMTAELESHLARHVHEGRCKDDECDGGKARTLWQVWRLKGMSDQKWGSMIGSDLKSTTAAAKYAARLFVMKRNYCKSITGAINAYASGKCWTVPDFDVDGRRELMMEYRKALKR